MMSLHHFTAPQPSFTPGRALLLQRKCACGGTPGPDGECAECRKKRLVRQRDASRAAEPAAAPPIVHEVLRSSGQPLDPTTRAFMERRFGHDFGQVRVHADAKATESARAVNALAYTVGHQVVFGEGQYAPQRSGGRRLLAHELTHVVQQQNAAPASPEIGGSNGPYERESDRVADSISTGQAAAVAPTKLRMPSLQRSSDSSGSSGGAAGGPIPTPTPKPDGTCECRLELCWRPIQAYWGIPGLLGYSHGFINMIDSKCQTHNLYVDPSMHKAGSTSHSHAVDSSPGWDTSGTTCHNLSSIAPSVATCPNIDKLPAATARYEAMDVAYDPTSGPNSNSFLEWILYESGISVSGLPSGLKAWDYYVKNPGMRSSPPRVSRAATPGMPAPAGGATP